MTESLPMTPQEVADALKITKNTVYELVKRGELAAYRVGRKMRFDPKDVAAYKDNRKTVALPGMAAVLRQGMEREGFIICGQDAVLDILARYMELRLKDTVNVLRSFNGSYNALYALYNGKASIATAHLWDSDSGEYNLPYVRRLLPGIPVLVYRLIRRWQGFYVEKGNPKNITDWSDLAKPGTVIVNREKGAGSRVLLDEHLRQLGINATAIAGYEWEETSHLAVASKVARGEADVGVGNEKAAKQVENLDFIPIQMESFDLVMKKEDAVKPEFQALIQILQSPAFKREIDGIGGYDVSQLGQLIAEI